MEPDRGLAEALAGPSSRLVGPTVEVQKTSRLQAVVMAVIWSASLVIFLQAGDDFSYDYKHYINSMDVLRTMSFQDMVLGLEESFPYPYVRIPPATLHEAGFGFLAWALLQIVGNSQAVYAVIAATSIAMRVWAMNRIGVWWPWVVLTNLFAITLFEANAIRLGCGVTAILLGISELMRGGSRFVAISLILASALFHLQTLLFAPLFLTVFYTGPSLLRSRATILVSAATLALSGPVVAHQLELHRPSKIADYIGGGMIPSEVGVVTTLAALAIMFSLWRLIRQTEQSRQLQSVAIDCRLWTSALFASIPSLMLFLVANEMVVVGNRAWQLAFVVLSALAFCAGGGTRKQDLLTTLLMTLLMTAMAINVLFRYPLSNFFWPLVPYHEIVPFL